MLSVSLCYLAKPGSGSNVSDIVLSSFVHIYEHVQRGITKVKIWNPYRRRKVEIDSIYPRKGKIQRRLVTALKYFKK